MLQSGVLGGVLCCSEMCYRVVSVEGVLCSSEMCYRVVSVEECCVVVRCVTEWCQWTV